MMAGVGAGVGLIVHCTGAMATGLGGELSDIWVAGIMVTLGGTVGWVSFGTLREGAEQSVWSILSGEGRGAFRVGAVGGIVVILEKMRESFLMAENCLLRSVANGVGVGCNRASESARAASVAALVELSDGTGQSWGKNLLFWRCALRRYVECRCGDTGSGQGRVRGNIH